ncbi:hypothetical protein [Pseudoalteromonas translucida]|uniref:Uncharacterized protein n=1 Tax=Pseudoalteromonas translucida (strain TAC 125) TaxID=326442 RepID=Q3IDR3_PSET1|nr:hypothetical protein [Pseudoalteromonas translucida]CAI85761.1 conserved protein of unknown function [Pseudoalteromonas translucida]
MLTFFLKKKPTKSTFILLAFISVLGCQTTKPQKQPTARCEIEVAGERSEELSKKVKSLVGEDITQIESSYSSPPNKDRPLSSRALIVANIYHYSVYGNLSKMSIEALNGKKQMLIEARSEIEKLKTNYEETLLHSQSGDCIFGYPSAYKKAEKHVDFLSRVIEYSIPALSALVDVAITNKRKEIEEEKHRVTALKKQEDYDKYRANQYRIYKGAIYKDEGVIIQLEDFDGMRIIFSVKNLSKRKIIKLDMKYSHSYENELGGVSWYQSPKMSLRDGYGNKLRILNPHNSHDSSDREDKLMPSEKKTFAVYVDDKIIKDSSLELYFPVYSVGQSEAFTIKFPSHITPLYF